MSFDTDFVFVSGLEKGYDSHKRALVRRKLRNSQCTPKSMQGGTVSDTHSTAKTAEWMVLYGKRCEEDFIRTSVDNVMAFDPFDSTSDKLAPEAQHLLRHYIWAGDWLFRGAHPHSILFRENMHDRASMAAMQAYAAYDLSRTGQCSGQLALAKRVDLIARINDSLGDPETALTDATLSAVLGSLAVDCHAASATLRAEHRAEAQAHVAGLARLVLMRGGPQGLAPWLRSFYHWMDLQMQGAITAAIYDLNASAGSATRLVKSPARSFEALCRAELLGLCTSSYIAARARTLDYQAASGGSSEYAPQPLGALFAPGSHFYTFLASPGVEDSPTRIAAILYCNLLVVDSVADPSALGAHLSNSPHLKGLLATGEGSTEALTFALLMTNTPNGRHTLYHPEKAAMIAKLLYAYHKMPRLLQLQIEEVLMSFLTPGKCNQEMMCDPDDFWMDVRQGQRGCGGKMGSDGL
ncbi:hypothetical protein LTR56_006517 [Elasticomyces elasticus]|nr:hypothetical protein LTR22_022058 [Elasticomyces elasticus]KAK3649930.1 hypothetical protein LTR56_006517 [Elasticomyces elasticus]KAK4931684.1 hypothetical protein LTR49_001749 [Elasticomyces elasticus]KAK5740729.1 hypothetical protein LTS12_024859 [Elasticomyces elasticus]